jgi:hypothetical protein
MGVGLSLLVVVSGAGESAEDVVRLKRQVRYLGEALAKSNAEVDGLKAKLDGRSYSAADGSEAVAPNVAVTEKVYRVLDVNKELGMVILDGGRRDGIRPGLQFAVIEKGQAVARVRIVDVRTAVAGAVVQEDSLGFPRVLDRAVLATGSRK